MEAMEVGSNLSGPPVVLLNSPLIKSMAGSFRYGATDCVRTNDRRRATLVQEIVGNVVQMLGPRGQRLVSRATGHLKNGSKITCTVSAFTRYYANDIWSGLLSGRNST